MRNKVLPTRMWMKGLHRSPYTLVILLQTCLVLVSSLSTRIHIQDLETWTGPDAMSSSFVLLHAAENTSPETCHQMFQAQILASTLQFGEPAVNVGTLALTREIEEKLPRTLRVSFETLPAWVSIVRHEQSELPHISAYRQGTSLHDATSYWMRMIKGLQPAALHMMLLSKSSVPALAKSTMQTAVLGVVNSSTCTGFSLIPKLRAVATAFAGEVHTVVGVVDLAREPAYSLQPSKNSYQAPSLWLTGYGAGRIGSSPHGLSQDSSADEILLILNKVS